MLKKTITYTDFNGFERTEDYYFNLTEAELTEMEMSTDGGLSEMIEQIIKSKNVPQIIAVFKDLLLKAYGEKSADGRHFYKSEQLAKDFACTQAYSDFYMELARDPDLAAKFIEGILPAKAVKEATKLTPITDSANQ